MYFTIEYSISGELLVHSQMIRDLRADFKDMLSGIQDLKTTMAGMSLTPMKTKLFYGMVNIHILKYDMCNMC